MGAGQYNSQHTLEITENKSALTINEREMHERIHCEPSFVAVIRVEQGATPAVHSC
jgi:hypothetical protein